ncbi:MAG: hypothetical protein Tsb0010_16580 [Parvularculaceae bacterium]
MNLVEKELALLRAQHRADIAEMREAAEVSRAELSALIAETRASIRSSRAMANNARFTITTLIFLLAVLLGGFIYYDSQQESTLRAELEQMRERIVRLTGADDALAAPALVIEPATRRAAPPVDEIDRTHRRRAPARRSEPEDAPAREGGV